jgi:dihydrolipoamide dehydrogenase
MNSIETEVVVVGGGPGGYAAAFYAADHGKKVLLIERDSRLGGVCLNRGCIPSKALLYATHMITESRESAKRGISFQEPKIDLSKLRDWKESILEKLGQGIAGLAKRRGVETIQGKAYFEDGQSLRVETDKGQQFVKFEQAVIAVGSQSALPKAFDLGNKRIMTSRGALQLEDIPERLLVVGGGYIGMEMGTVYAGLGSKVVMVEAMDGILMGADPDLVKPVAAKVNSTFEEVRVKAKVTKMATQGKQILVEMEHEGKTLKELYDRVLVAVGRKPNCADIGLENTQVQLDEKGFIQVDDSMRTNESRIYAIGDVIGGVMLAHKASKEARIAVSHLLGDEVKPDSFIIPAVVFTDPEIAWCGLTEAEAKKKNIPVKVARFPWAASGRALSFDRTEGLTKLIIDPDTERLLGVGITGPNAGEMIAEGVVAIEMGATAEDLANCVHPHPTLSETLMEAAEVFYGKATHMAAPRKS